MAHFRNLRLLIKCYPIAKGRVFAHSDSKYNGAVRMQIAYNETRTEIVKRGICDDENIIGAVVYLAISLAYLLNK